MFLSFLAVERLYNDIYHKILQNDHDDRKRKCTSLFCSHHFFLLTTILLQKYLVDIMNVAYIILSHLVNSAIIFRRTCY